MGKWIYEYDVNRHVKKAKPEQFREVAQKIFNELDGKPGFDGFDLTKLLTVESPQEFDEVWKELYDYADVNRIWLGL